MDSITNLQAQNEQLKLNELLLEAELAKYRASWQEKVFNSKNLNVDTLDKIFGTIIKSDDLKRLVSELRANDNEDWQKKFKAENFPYFNLGLFRDGHRKNENLISTSFFIFDYDHLNDKLNNMLLLLKEDPSVFAFFISPRGNGLKVIYLLDKPITDHELFSSLYKYYADKYNVDLGAEPDKTSDASRPCFFSYDPDMYININAQPLSTNIQVQSITAKTNPPALNLAALRDEDLKFLPTAIEHLRKDKLSYRQWCDCGFALASLGETGRQHFLNLSMNEHFPKDTIESIDDKFDEFLKNRRSINLATLFQIAKDRGYVYPNLSKEEELPAKVVSMAERLRERFILDDSRDPNKLLGYPLTKFKVLAENIDGVQPGFYFLCAETNVGKTAFLTNLCLDAIETNPEISVLYFSLNDASIYTVYRFLGIMTGLKINSLQKRIDNPVEKELRQEKRGEFLKHIESGRLIIKDLEEVTHVSHIEAELKKVKDPGKLIVFIDGLYNLQVESSGGIREENIERASVIKRLVDVYRIPLFTTGELRKKTKGEGKDKNPVLSDAMETGKFGYNANVAWLLYAKSDELKNDISSLTLEYAKNKLSSFKGTQNLSFIRATGTMEENNLCVSLPVGTPFANINEDGGELD
jgi:hypothetical protein